MNSNKFNLEKFQSGYIDVGDGKLYYEQAGEGEAIILLHDGLIHNVVWDRQFEYFSTSHRVVRYDRRGFGNSPLPTDKYSSINDLKIVYEKLHLDKATLCGMSAGGRLALDYAIKYPEKVDKLILVGAVISGFEFTDHFLTRGGHRPENLDPKSDSYRNYWTDNDPYEIWEGNPATRQLTKKILSEYPNNTDPVIFRLEDGPERPAIKALNEINVPTIVLIGEYDTPDVHAHAGAIDAMVCNSVRSVIPKAGHRVPMEQPELLIDRIINLSGKFNFQEISKNNGVSAAIEWYKYNKANTENSYKMTEMEINSLGYQYLMGNKIEDAILLFELYIEEFPNSANAYDSYGEVLMAKGDTVESINNYNKSLELNPDNSNAVQMLKKLQKLK